MIAALLLLAPAQIAVQVPAPPADWRHLPLMLLPVRDIAAEPTAFVRREVAAGRCTAAVADAQGMTLTATVAVLVDAAGAAMRIVPQAIGCPTVEQYTAGYVSTLLRAGANPGPVAAPGWHRLPISYRW